MITEAQKRFQAIKTLISHHNISIGLLRIVTGQTQTNIRNMLTDRKGQMGEDNYHILLNAITTIQKYSKEELYQRYIRGAIQPKRANTNPNVNSVREFLEENNIKLYTAAALLGYTPAGFGSLLGRNRMHDISDDTKNEIILKIKQHLSQLQND